MQSTCGVFFAIGLCIVWGNNTLSTKIDRDTRAGSEIQTALTIILHYFIATFTCVFITLVGAEDIGRDADERVEHEIRFALSFEVILKIFCKILARGRQVRSMFVNTWGFTPSSLARSHNTHPVLACWQNIKRVCHKRGSAVITTYLCVALQTSWYGICLHYELLQW